jgi:arginine N-succinyltransferase
VFLVRAAEEADLAAVLGAAEYLDSFNLPHDPQRLAEIIDRSTRSFAGRLEASRRELLFVLVERTSDGTERVVGSSMIFAQHGSRLSPHTYFDVLEEERYSETLDRHFRHTVLRIGYNYRGLTEIGGLVLQPAYRGRPEQLGKLLAYIRFLYIALHREVFRDEVVSELMPPLEPDGRSLLWESLGRHFTGLSYQEADRISRENKEFIRTLFPQDPIYATLLPENAQALIGQVGPSSRPVERLLRRIGFAFAHRIDPFDGGPHFHAATDEITLVKTTRRATVRGFDEGAAGDPPAVDALVSAERPEAPFFRAVRAMVRPLGDAVILPQTAAAALQVGIGDPVAVAPLPGSEPERSGRS